MTMDKAEPVVWQVKLVADSSWLEIPASRVRAFKEDAQEVRALYSETDYIAERERAERAENALAEEFFELHIVFADDGGPANLRFVETERLDGVSINVGTWRDRQDGLKTLVLSVHKSNIKGM